MRKLILLLALCLPTLAHADDTLAKKKALELINSTVQIENKDSQGTGIILYSEISEDDPRIKKTYVLTNEHVVEKGDAACKVSTFVFLKQRNTVGKRQYDAKVVFISDDYDIALVEIETPITENFKTVKIASTESWDEMTLCDKVYLVSCGAGTVPCLTKGTLSSVNKAETEMGMTASIIFGSSGGGIYNSKGELIGLANAVKVTRQGRHPIPHKALGIPLTTILKEIENSDYDFILEEADEAPELEGIPDNWHWDNGEKEEEDNSNKKPNKIWY